MKKLLFFFLVLSAMKDVSAQGYHSMLPTDTVTWQHFNCMIGVKPAGELNSSSFNVYDSPIAAIDTITLNSFLYKKIYVLYSYSINYANKSLLGYMREDTVAKKVYFRENQLSTETLLYDFSMNVGDSMLITMNPSANFSTGFFRTDSIVVKNTFSGPRKHFYMRKHQNNGNPNQNYLVFIEGIGSTLHILYPYANNVYNFCIIMPTPACNHPWSLGMSCKHEKKIKKYQSCTFTNASQSSCIGISDSCNYRNYCNSIRKNKLTGNFSIYPNPASDRIIVGCEEMNEAPVIIEIKDLPGKIIYRKEFSPDIKNQIEIETADLKTGIYFLKIISEKNSSIYEISIAH